MGKKKLKDQKFRRFNFSLYYFKTLAWFVIGSCLAAIGVQVFLVPNQFIDGGIVGLSIMAAHFFGQQYLPYFLIIFNIPFVILAYKHIGKHFVLQMISAVFIFSLSLAAIYNMPFWLKIPPLIFKGSDLEVIVLGGFIIGCGIGLIIRNGGSTDGTEILGIIINKKRGFSIGQVILFVNIFIFTAAGLSYKNWHTAFVSLMTYVVATKVMDMVIVGFEDTKSVTIITSMPKQLGKVLIDSLGIGLTYLNAEGGYTGEKKQLLYIVVERLLLSELKEIVSREDPQAFIAIENLHEVINGRNNKLH